MRAVVTGIGVVTPVGRDVDTFFDALCAPRSGLVRPPADHVAAGMIEAVGIAPDVDPFSVVSRTDAAVADRFSIMAMAAADDAIVDAGIKIGQDVDPLRTAVVVSTGAGGMQTFERQAVAMANRGVTGVTPYLYAGFLPNMSAARIAIKYGIRGYSSAISTACSAGAHAIAEALRLISADEADVVVCGGTEASLGATGIAGFRNARALATGWSDPTLASRPFDKRRNGFVLGEGGGVLVIERADSADARGAAGYADLTGWGATTDAYHLVMPNPDGASVADCMRIALASAGASAAEVGYLNAHGTSTRIGDIAEARGIQQQFGDNQPPVSSTKGVTGHLLGGAGAVEAAATILALAYGRLPPTHNLEEPDERCELNHIRGEARRERPQVALSNSSAFGGHNVSLVFEPASTRRRRTHEGKDACAVS
ncbi:beta-ketoacyl-[acyl-carrier-protein] synthase family protein [Streptomyces sp. NBC_00243]|uniref:beta-ketoacyl-[acyl-carrier-protein] synthase family protein n=1 Tax=Streptomyces sp. NBC_00243 TaxID=2975688 RepID=UPI002DDA8032|nr:beta-ketoacyl-[acyl-carrier-protein] synthase family protein [Streptomyces sp. NBC_00243]WRZ17353.1 beta-ketoacyl-[acyl-carrier-protein] synthase family protein [Streptomyces sp. NBC_00243]